MPRQDEQSPKGLNQRSPLRRLFQALVFRTFFLHLGVQDRALTEYLTDLLSRFVHVDQIFRLRDARGRRLREVAEMLAEAYRGPRLGPREREIHKHIGDFTLFWSGVYPEALRFFQAQTSRDHLLDYLEQGKRSYSLAARFDQGPLKEEAAVLRRLSQEFESCVWGLHIVRQNWEKLGDPSYDAATDILLGPLT